MDAPDDYTQTNFKNIMGAEIFVHRLLGTMIRLCGDELLWKVHKRQNSSHIIVAVSKSAQSYWYCSTFTSTMVMYCSTNTSTF